MKRAVWAIGAGVCVIAVVAVTTAQTPPVIYQAPGTPVPAGMPYSSPAYGTATQAYTAGSYPYSGSPMPAAYYAPAPSVAADDGPAVSGLLQKWASASGSEKAKTEQELRDALKERFQASLTSDETEIRRLEGELKQRRDKLALLRRRQDEIIDVHLRGLLLQSEGIRWPCGFIYSGANPCYVPVVDSSGSISYVSRPAEAGSSSSTSYAPYVVPPATTPSQTRYTPTRYTPTLYTPTLYTPPASPPPAWQPYATPPTVSPPTSSADSSPLHLAPALAPAPPSEPPPPAAPAPATKSVVRPATAVPAPVVPAANSPLFKNLKPVHE